MGVARSCWVSIQRLRVAESVCVLYKVHLTACNGDALLKCYLSMHGFQLDSRPLEPKVVGFKSYNC